VAQSLRTMYTRSGSVASPPVSSYFWEVLSSTLDPKRLIPESRTAGSLAWPTFVAKSFSISVCRSKSKLETVYQYVYILIVRVSTFTNLSIIESGVTILELRLVVVEHVPPPFRLSSQLYRREGFVYIVDASSESTHASILSQRRFNNSLASSKGLRKM
jgi:hypothetical protein